MGIGRVALGFLLLPVASPFVAVVVVRSLTAVEPYLPQLPQPDPLRRTRWILSGMAGATYDKGLFVIIGYGFVATWLALLAALLARHLGQTSPSHFLCLGALVGAVPGLLLVTTSAVRVRHLSFTLEESQYVLTGAAIGALCALFFWVVAVWRNPWWKTPTT
jgi:hypothetical protein